MLALKALFTAAIGASVAAAASPLCSGRTLVPGTTFDRLITIFFENEDRSTVINNAYWAGLAKTGINQLNYFGVAHPSQPNYIAYVSGSTNGVTDDANHNISAISVADRLEAKGISWGAYAENLPYSSFAGATDGIKSSYCRKHEPFISFDNIRNNAARVKNIKPATAFETDLNSGNLPQFTFFVPNLLNDGHDSNTTFAGAWLKSWLAKYGPAIAGSNTLLHITFDESESYVNPNLVYSVLTGGAVPDAAVGTSDSTTYNHYSALALMEKNWGFAPLVASNDGAATPFKGLTKQNRCASAARGAGGDDDKKHKKEKKFSKDH